MIQNFSTIMTALYTAEGGFVNDPRDPGGPTNLGVTAREWAAWSKVPLSTVTLVQMQALTEAETTPLYKANYWNAINGDELPSGIDAMIMFMEVNAGGCAAIELQSIVGAVPLDGQIGPKTLGNVSNYIRYAGVSKLIDAISIAQLQHYKTLLKFAIYGNGWTKRVNSVQMLAHQLAGI